MSTEQNPTRRSRWYEEEDNVADLARWLTSHGELHSAREVLDIFDRPDQWTDRWVEYQESRGRQVAA